MQKRKILIADDEQHIRSLVGSILGKHNLVLTAINGREAIDIARSEKPDLILMDIMMPELDVYTACSTIKTDPETKMIPVVMLTGLDAELNKKLSRQIGADGYITKPFTVDGLLAQLDEFLDKGDIHSIE